MRRLLPSLLCWPPSRAWPGFRAGPTCCLRRRGRKGPAMLGVATCASMACHNANGDLGSKGSEYSTFIAVDPHARAYRALFNADSLRIQKALLGEDPGKERLQEYGKSAHENKLCLKCHGMGADVPQALHADGVGCEQCHGPAQNWKSRHYLPGFDRRTAGFRDLRKLDIRAASCTGCHVGDATRQVDHDLIAAGHPRLKFEYGAYYANYPRHWTYREAAERRGDPAREARNWLVGQAASAEAALELLAARAKGPSWPEFAEYECTACHHGLTEPSERLKRFVERNEARAKAGKDRLKPGRLPWGTWYHGHLPLFADRSPGRLPALVARLDAEMSKRGPDGGKVAKDARKAAALLRAWAKEEATKPGMGGRAGARPGTAAGQGRGAGARGLGRRHAGRTLGWRP